MPGVLHGPAGRIGADAAGQAYALPGVFAPNHRLREQVTPARRGRHQAETTDELAATRHVSMTWAQRLKRVFNIAIETCEHCGGAVGVIASIEDPAVIKSSRDQEDP